MHTAYTSKVYGPPQLPDASLGSHSLTSRGAIALALSKPGQPVSQGQPPAHWGSIQIPDYL